MEIGRAYLIPASAIMKIRPSRGPERETVLVLVTFHRPNGPLVSNKYWGATADEEDDGDYVNDIYPLGQNPPIYTTVPPLMEDVVYEPSARRTTPL